ncbi:hypothetical protein DSO57_1020765 [Entomophthora muscae]|uniref:Uncharacterized protein n=1 Tax=Entomophthora muscae TaxID=34485 RepID=A0ACC2RUR2_9FUNG|nr:hypothetical protein DSO57_1020765 [Entomophthora muscae]
MTNQLALLRNLPPNKTRRVALDTKSPYYLFTKVGISMLKETRVKCDPSLKASLSEQNGGELSRILLLVYSREPLSLGSLAGMHEKVSTYSLVFDGSRSLLSIDVFDGAGFRVPAEMAELDELDSIEPLFPHQPG